MAISPLLLFQRGSTDVVGVREQSLSGPLSPVEDGKGSCTDAWKTCSTSIYMYVVCIIMLYLYVSSASVSRTK